jgi:SAM-dependent methyltransferase
MAEALYDTIGAGYARYRRADPRIGARITTALGDARTVVNVGSGAGSYEPADRSVVAVEPSAAMVAQRADGAAPAVRADALALPFPDGAFDAALAILTIHHWPDWRVGLAEMRRVSRKRVVVLTWDPASEGFWLVRDYFPEMAEIDRRTMPSIREVAGALGGAEVEAVPVPWDCTDGFLGAYWRRPEAYLDAGRRGAISSFARLADPAPGLERLRRELADGTWARRNAVVTSLDELNLGYRLVVSRRG